MGCGIATLEHRHVGVMWKTVSEDCNLACDYCYYSTCGGKPGPKINRIDSAILEKFIKEYMARSRGAASFAWQEASHCWRAWSSSRRSCRFRPATRRRGQASAIPFRRTVR